MGRGGKKPGIRKWLEWAALSANCSAIKNNPTQFLPQFRAHYQNCPDAIPENSISRNECVVRGWLEGGGGGGGAGGVDWMTRKWNGEITVVGSVATKWNYTRIEIMNDARIFRLEIRVKRDTGGFTCPVVSKNRGPYFQMEITESRKTCKWADTSSELIERFHRHTANPAKGTRERYNTHALRYTRVWKHTHTYIHVWRCSGGREGRKRGRGRGEVHSPGGRH